MKTSIPGRLSAHEITPSSLPSGIHRSPRGALIALALVCLTTIVVSRTLFEAAIVALGVAALVVASFPFLTRSWWHPVEPITWVVVLVIWGVTLKLVWIGLYGINSYRVGEVLLRGHQPRLLLPGVYAVLVSMICIVIGYSIHLRPLQLANTALIRRERWMHSALVFVCGVVTLVALVSFAVFILQSGGLTAVSAKRFAELEGGPQARLSSISYLWFRLSLLAVFPFFVLLAWNRRQDRRKSFMSALLLVVSGALAIAVPIYASNRARIGLLVIDVVVISYLLRRKVNKRIPFLAAAIVLLASASLLALRSAAPITVLQSLESTVFGRDAFDVSKTGQIVSSGKTDLGGQTLVGWIVAPIPESIMPNKPLWAELDRYVWTEVIRGEGPSGIPAGLIGEMYLNFWWPGIAVGSFIFGLALRVLWQSFRHLLDKPNAALIYGVAVTRFTVFTLTNDVGTGISKTLLDLIPLVALLMFISRVERRWKRGHEGLEEATSPLAGHIQETGLSRVAGT